jgi:hypothetical protein
MAFALEKKIILANPDVIKRTEGKSFNNVLFALQSKIIAK